MMPMVDDFGIHYMTHGFQSHNAPTQLLLPPPPYTHRPASPHSDTPYSSPTSSPLHSPYLSPVPSPGASPCPSPTPQIRTASAPSCKSPYIILKYLHIFPPDVIVCIYLHTNDFYLLLFLSSWFRSHPAMAISAGAANRSRLPELHLMDWPRVGVQAY